MSYEDLEKWKEQDNEIVILTKNLNHLIEKCLGNMGIEEYETIQGRMEVLIEQGMFWIKENNSQRFAYDLRQFTSWLCDFIGDKEREFWGEDAKEE